MTTAIEARELGKRYRLGEAGYVTLREQLGGLVRRDGTRSAARDVWALRDVEVDVNQGDIVGLVGRNGAGKTTFLKSVARIVRPTTGLVRVRGRVGALLEIGTGFHAELTGRENVFLNGVVLGMTRKDIKLRFDDIVEFAGVERFLETPLKRYSMGMYLRLAFAVAAHVEPDVLVVDEVLAVGDAEFQRRCLGRMSEFGREGRTILFVSHDSGAVGRLCRRAIWLEQGQIKLVGDAHSVIEAYLETTTSSRGAPVHVAVSAGSPVTALSAALLDDQGNPVDRLARDRPLRFQIGFTLAESLPRFDLSVYVLNGSRFRVLDDALSDSGTQVVDAGRFTATLTVPPILTSGDYIAGIWLASEGEAIVHEEVLQFTLTPRPDDRISETRRDRVIRPHVAWDVRARTHDDASGAG